MVSRRNFIAAAGIGLAAPFIGRSRSRATTVRVRRDVMELADNDPFFSKYADAVKAMHQLPETDGRNWRRQAKIHADFCKHGQLEFLHWHRHYLNFFEAICGELIGDPDFALPYWNWSKKSGVIPAPFYDIDALNVEFWKDPGVYNGISWGPIDSVPKRGLVKGRGLLNDPQRGGSFTLDRINGIKRLPNVTLFQRSLEGSPHNDGHVVSGALPTGNKAGHIGDGLSPLDSIFWLHHCMVDRVWAEWQKAGHTTPDPGATYAGNFFDKKGVAVTVTAGGALNIAPLGYTYDVLEPTTQAAPPTGALLNAIAPQLENAVAAEPVKLGGTQSEGAAAPLVETALKVSAPGLVAAVGGDRAFRQLSVGKQASLNVEGKRILASFTGVKPPQDRRDLVVNVFVNCPYLSPSTGYVDPHYAGTFSFFSGVHHGADGYDFVVDITAPVRSLVNEGRIKDDQLTVQLMPLPAYMDAQSDSTFQPGQVEIITV
jgi:tyrosinase